MIRSLRLLGKLKTHLAPETLTGNSQIEPHPSLKVGFSLNSQFCFGLGFESPLSRKAKAKSQRRGLRPQRNVAYCSAQLAFLCGPSSYV